MPPLDGRVALVTGASGGIGAAVARSLHDAGASVGLLSRRGEDMGLERALGFACDVRDRAAVERATEQVVERFGRLDIAVANAGVGSYTEFAIGTGREHGDPGLEQMMSAEDVAEVVLFAVTRPRNLRILTTTFRPMSEDSTG